MNFPHDNVFARLQASAIHGVGVFAIQSIPRGTKIFRPDPTDIVWIDRNALQRLPSDVRELYEDFCIVRNGQLGCPSNFNAMTPSWYLNHSDQPNVVCDDHFEFVASRDIRKGEELTVDYETYNSKA